LSVSVGAAAATHYIVTAPASVTSGSSIAVNAQLADLYDKMSSTPVTPDLEDLWRRLGVQRIDDGVRFDEAAPLAQVCKAITASARR